MTVRREARIADIPRDLFDALVPPGNPSMRWEWLSVLEETAHRTGQSWEGTHLLVWDRNELVAVAPLWWREDSWGDFVFDQQLAAWARSRRLPYYPKLVGTVPFTAAMGYRVLHAPDDRGWEALTLALRAAADWARERGTSLNLLWLEPNWLAHPEVMRRLVDLGGVFWGHPHFWWERRGWASYADFLDSLDKNRRRNARRELESAHQHGLEVVIRRADQCPASWHARMAELYHRTNDQFGWMAARFLDSRFFAEAARTAGRWIWYVAALAPEDSDPVAMSFLLSDGVHWIGRYWGELQFYKNLHFQLCYHEPLRHILDGNGQSFDPGMGSPHKLHRGFEPFTAVSWHLFFQPEVDRIVRDSL